MKRNYDNWYADQVKWFEHEIEFAKESIAFAKKYPDLGDLEFWQKKLRSHRYYLAKYRKLAGM